MAQNKAKYNKKTLYFNQDNLDVYYYLCEMKDMSDYICKLVRADMGLPKDEIKVDLSEVMSELKRLNSKIDNIKVSGVQVEPSKNNEPINYGVSEMLEPKPIKKKRVRHKPNSII